MPLSGLGVVQGIAYLARKQAFQGGHVSAFIACISLTYFSFSNLLFLCIQIVTQKILPSPSAFVSARGETQAGSAKNFH